MSFDSFNTAFWESGMSSLKGQNSALGKEREAFLLHQLSAGSLSNLDLKTQDFVSDYVMQQAADLLQRRKKTSASDAVVPSNSFRRQGVSPMTATPLSQPLLASLKPAVVGAPASSMELPMATASSSRAVLRPFLRTPAALGMGGSVSSIDVVDNPRQLVPPASGGSFLSSRTASDGLAMGSPRPFRMIQESSPLPYASPAVPQSSPLPGSQLLSPGALARQQRASADEKRGKRRRPVVDSKPLNNSVGASADSQVVPEQIVEAPKAPVVKVKEERRKKKLLRNRVSAQQARERKRQQVIELEQHCGRIEQNNARLERHIVHLTKENEELRHFVRGNMRAVAAHPEGGSIGSGMPQVGNESTFSVPTNVDLTQLGGEVGGSFDVSDFISGADQNLGAGLQNLGAGLQAAELQHISNVSYDRNGAVFLKLPDGTIWRDNDRMVSYDV